MKYLSTRKINVAQRRRRLQAELDSADPFVSRKKLLDFVSDNTLRESPTLETQNDKCSNSALDLS